MPFDFPSSPSEGQIFNAPSGPSYVFNAPVWKAVGQGQIAIIADAAPANPANGQLWWESDTGILWVYYNDGNSSQWVQAGGVYAPVGTAETRNRIVNGAMQVSQEYGNTAFGPAVTLAGHNADQWNTGTGTSPGTATTQRVQVTTPNGSKDRWRCTVGTAKAALAAGDYVTVTQAIEGVRIADFLWGSAGARQIVLRFGWKSPAGTYSVNLGNSGSGRTYLVNFTITAGQANTNTVQTLIIPGDVTGTWPTDTSGGIYLSFSIACGTTYQGVAGWQNGGKLGTASNTNGMATAGAVFELFDVGLYLDPDRTGVAPAWQMPDEAEELRACMRYWEGVGITISTNSTLSNTSWFQAQKRVPPALTLTAGTAAGATFGVMALSQLVGIRQLAASSGISDGFLVANARM